MSPDDGVLGLSERFAGLERTLGRIETKLDQKVGTEQFTPLLHRVEMLEGGDSPLGKHLINQFTIMQQQMADVILHGSQQAQEAVREIDQIKLEIREVENAATAARAVVKSDQERDFKTMRIWGIVLSACTTTSVALGAILALTH